MILAGITIDFDMQSVIGLLTLTLLAANLLFGRRDKHSQTISTMAKDITDIKMDVAALKTESNLRREYESR